MSNEKIKFYKNPHRDAAITGDAVKTYTPQYQVMGIEPLEHKGGVASAIAPPTPDNPRNRRPLKSQSDTPSTVSAPSPLGRGKSPMLNVGNNIEHSWSVGVDNQIVDDLEEQTPVDPSRSMVDNNEFVTNSALGLPEELPTLDEVKNPPRKRFTQDEVSAAYHVSVQATELDLVSALRELEEGTYLLLVEGVPVCSGPKDEIQEQARALVFGEHELCGGNPVSVDDIVILRRAEIKVGLFLE